MSVFTLSQIKNSRCSPRPWSYVSEAKGGAPQNVVWVVSSRLYNIPVLFTMYYKKRDKYLLKCSGLYTIMETIILIRINKCLWFNISWKLQKAGSWSWWPCSNSDNCSVVACLVQNRSLQQWRRHQRWTPNAANTVWWFYKVLYIDEYHHHMLLQSTILDAHTLCPGNFWLRNGWKKKYKELFMLFWNIDWGQWQFCEEAKNKINKEKYC